MTDQPPRSLGKFCRLGTIYFLLRLACQIWRDHLKREFDSRLECVTDPANSEISRLDPCQPFLLFPWVAFQDLLHGSLSDMIEGHKHAPECFLKMHFFGASKNLARVHSGDRTDVLCLCRFLQISFARDSLCPMQLQICMVAHQRKLLDQNSGTDSHESARRMRPERSSY